MAEKKLTGPDLARNAPLRSALRRCAASGLRFEGGDQANPKGRGRGRLSEPRRSQPPSFRRRQERTLANNGRPYEFAQRGHQQIARRHSPHGSRGRPAQVLPPGHGLQGFPCFTFVDPDRQL